ncbi:MAG: AAA family ATPase [Bryobacteraceae bacterium]
MSGQLYFGTKAGYPDRYPVWSRCVTHGYPKEGLRLPYQEYLRGGHDLSKIACYVPAGSMLAFSYVGEHVSDDVAVGVLERLLQSVEAVIADSKVAGNWPDQLRWLNDVLSEVWSNRGPFPGIGSVLRFLEMPRGTLFQRTVLLPRVKKGENPWEYVRAILDGKREPDESEYNQELRAAATRWKSYPASRRPSLALLTRFELSADQVTRIAKPEKRAHAGIQATDEELCGNPYVICEQDQGDATSERVELETIDRGMRPEGNAALFIKTQDQIPQDDPRRVRAAACAVLSEAAKVGDTLLPFDEALRLISSRFPERRACSPDGDLVITQAKFFREALQFLPDNDFPLIALKHLADVEDYVRNILSRRVKKMNDAPPQDFDWNPLLDEAVGPGEGTALRDETEKRARMEKIAALNTLVERRFSALTGSAGTGKTSVLVALLDGLKELEGRTTVLLLAPTGKARVRLSTKTGRNASTIHQFLLKQEWLRKGTFTLKYSAGLQAGASTVIIDEASMIPMDLLGVLFRALDLNRVRRLILVGDPNQLPPIGPGRPFSDIIAWLEEDAERAGCIARLEERARHESHDSWALRLADGYQRDVPKPGDGEVLASVAQEKVQGDLEVHFWKDHVELYDQLHSAMARHLNISGEKEYVAFNESLGVVGEDWKRAEAWQILGVVRGETFGTSELNRIIQGRYKRGLIIRAQRQEPRPFGDQEIVWTDKVIQIRNDARDAWPRDTGLDYVANGEIGIVSATSKEYDSLDVSLSTQPDVTYRYYRSQVDENLELAYALTASGDTQNRPLRVT